MLTVSPKTRLQTILSHRCLGGDERWPPAAIPLSAMQMSATGGYQYQSAIAHPVAAAQGQPVLTVAHAIAQHLTTRERAIPDSIATGLVAQVLPTGNLELTLAPVGVAAWWQQCGQGGWPDAPPAIGIKDGPPPRPGQWPLGDRLHLSLPMLMQWAYRCCGKWSLGPPTITEPSPLQSTQQLDPLTAVLQPVLIQCWDQLAAQPLAVNRWQQSGYELAQAIYQLEAQRSHWSPRLSSCPEAAMTRAITQTFLALLLQVLTGAPPQSDL
ncbi:hypothetical protein [Leptolyngbya iicbica]|uniref:Uncharacterized protein n=2 Tax=Cyanophyceae TaxID=3028117 RepID=A0A4Q7E606_9CYAN|nr:hypothetical protein DYY88_17360 [Leptolyngbya sp. LK]